MNISTETNVQNNIDALYVEHNIYSNMLLFVQFTRTQIIRSAISRNIVKC